MGLDNRDYIRDEQRRYSQGGYGFGSGRPGPMSITTIIIIINVVVFFLDAFTPKIDNVNMHWLANFLAMDTGSLWRVWAFLTHGFAHAGIDSDIGIMHLAGNMITLFFLGRYVEMSLGRQEYLKFYLAAIVVSGVVFAISRVLRMQPGDPGTICLGASGAVTAVVALFIFMYPKVTVLLFFVVPMPAWVVGVLLVGLDLYRAFEPNTVIAWESHLAGAAFGCLYYVSGWRFTWLDLGWFSKLVSGRPQLRVHDPDSRFEKLKSEADRLLAKINEQGEESLSTHERKILNRYSRELRNRRE